MTKSDLIVEVAKKLAEMQTENGSKAPSQTLVYHILETAFAAMSSALARGDAVKIRAFGTLRPQYIPARTFKSNIKTIGEGTTAERVSVRWNEAFELSQAVSNEPLITSLRAKAP